MVAPLTPLPAEAYVPVLKAKQGELLAIQTTPPDMFVPLLETADSAKVAHVSRAWPHKDHVIWVHPLNVNAVDDSVWLNEVESIFARLHNDGRQAVPVVTTSESAGVYGAVRQAVLRDSRGIVIRIDCEDALEGSAALLSAELSDVRSECSVDADECDLVIDAGMVSGGPAVQSSVVGSVLDLLPDLHQWRSIVVAFSAFPEAVGKLVAPNSVGSIPRTDASSFAHLTSHWTKRILSFADYGVGVPVYADTPWAPIPNIRYALPSEWRVFRAHTKRDPSPQYIALARDLAAQSYFDGTGASAGDDYIQAVANGADGPGNAGSYLKAAMSRHFYVVLSSLATRGVP
ncbi:hypothetical protein G6027_10275 [Dietzia sp. SLG310A2-38A2]|uniref:beta family protein n=1 Tax=Dietzia sp. SLG310A2-38A2 TaxID=1630643 RepID=UPI0015FDE84D|nr:beta family protein [Dietzia sp. SLG310A2-38A2]MBB1031266.1 hypothetical protein [Dietzia sp. SLG310A2-38A2]